MERTYTKLICTECKNPFERLTSNVKPTPNLFCNNTCKNEWNRKRPRKPFKRGKAVLRECPQCDTPRMVLASHASKSKDSFCNITCKNIYLAVKRTSVAKWVTKPCEHCKTIVTRSEASIKRSKTKYIFCGHTCAATYNNTHKTTGTRKSKLEVWLEKQLPTLYPQYTFMFNDKTTIHSELDIYIPELKLAFELNGIFHYEPIYGDDKLNQIQNNDKNKFQKCQEAGISLCVIDVSGLKYFKDTNAQKYLDIITNIIGTGGEDRTHV